MLYLTFQLGGDRYALVAGDIVEVLPLLPLKHWLKAPPAIVGLCVYRGQPVPVLDLSVLCLGQPSQRRLGSRLVIVRYPDAQAPSRVLALLVEDATDTVRVAPQAFTEAGLRSNDAPYLGAVAPAPAGLLQRLDVAQLLSPEVRATLFVDVEAACTTAP